MPQTGWDKQQRFIFSHFWRLLWLLISQKVVSEFATPWIEACQASLSFTISQSLLKLMSFESVMPSSHLILCRPLLLLLSVLPSMRVFFSELALWIRWPKYWSFSFSISPSDEYSGWFPLGLTGLISLLSKGLSRVFSSATIQKHQFCGAQPSLSLSQIYNNSKSNSNINGKIVTAATCQWMFTVRQSQRQVLLCAISVRQRKLL